MAITDRFICLPLNFIVIAYLFISLILEVILKTGINIVRFVQAKLGELIPNEN